MMVLQSINNNDSNVSLFMDETSKPSTFLRTLVFPGNHSNSKKRVRGEMSRPEQQELDDYDNDVARAIRSNDLPRLRELLDEGRSFGGYNRNMETQLHLACRRGDLEIVEFLICDIGVNVEIRDSLGRTALHDMCWRPCLDYDMMDFMIRTVSPELLIAEDVRGHACLDYVRKEQYGDCIEFLKNYTTLLQRRSKLIGMIALD
jgi:ankyrin repeat protein